MCDQYLLSYYKDEIIEILKDQDEHKHFSVNVNFVEMSGNEPNLVNDFLREPEKTLEEWNNALKRVETNLLLQFEDLYTIKNNIHCRIYSLPMYPELHRTKFPQNDDVNKFLQVTGTVVRTTQMKMLEYQRQYICTKCKHTMVVTAEYEMKNVITPPRQCTNPEGCKGTTIVNLGELDPTFCKDYQEVKMQETVNKLDIGCMPSSIWVTLEDDLVDSCKPGDNVTVCGLVKRRSSQFIIGGKIDIELVIRANHVHVNNNSSAVLSITPELKDMFQAFWHTYSGTPLAARDMILKSICPELYGLFIVKLAVAVVLAGGSSQHTKSDTGVRVRAEPHLLLVGDPGTGKSQLLRFASKIIPRSVFTTGVGSTAAGLTVTAVMENGEWQLEGGALVMSDGGICCIDEFNTMKEHDRTSIHEAMEQQTISVAKAGIVCKLSTRCSILAATNPKGNLDASQPLHMNVALASPLLSRFDLILLIKDKVDDGWDSQMIDYIFTARENSNSSKLIESINWTIETLQAYFAIIKKNHPMLNDDAHRILSGYYQAQRRKNCRNKSRTTVRLLDSLVRLSQGHARLMFHKEVEIVDAVLAVILVETAMECDSSVFNLNFDTRRDFPLDPEQNYRELAQIVLQELQLNDLLEKEFAKGVCALCPGNANCVHKNTKMFEKIIKVCEPQPSTSKINENEKINTAHNKNSDARPSSSHVNKDKIELDEKDTRKKQIGESITIANEEEIIKNKRNITKNVNKDITEEPVSNKKRNKRENPPNPKRIKLKSKENEIKDDLAALNAMPSVNDIFRMDNEIGVTIEQNKPEETEPSQVPSQRTKTRQFLHKFRFVPKEDRPPIADETTCENLEISFKDVKSSTMLEPEENVKKFKFKKASKHVEMFESLEDLDDLDLDI
ncbi:DNA helicase MCM9 [Tribolium castaneum]|uniref:DNA helicase MCM9 n=1 Tax=Tribolium castaneum TaxID=7070 RepID=D6WB76_TRICA|nr:PREDICTED: DNA helicase MCM9 [Tribolium castaneum]EEZ97925.1 DNA replication licensing factor Mcm2-like Protein [Tribolium castaneum]|eukprot:XP_971324.1 PREDICTED: DNA helicase MCM9 [Tribolium castaneum]